MRSEEDLGMMRSLLLLISTASSFFIAFVLCFAVFGLGFASALFCALFVGKD